jgi:hypothetical protein
MVKKLACPAYTNEKTAAEGGYKFTTLQCQFSVDLVKVDELQAQYDLLLHLKSTHPRWWNRHGKKQVVRFSKRVAMRR